MLTFDKLNITPSRGGFEMENGREFYIWDVDLNRLIGMRLIDEGIEPIYNDSLSDQEITSISAQ